MLADHLRQANPPPPRCRACARQGTKAFNVKYLHRNTNREQAEDLLLQFNATEVAGVFLLRRKNKIVRVLSICTEASEAPKFAHHTLEDTDQGYAPGAIQFSPQ